MVSVPGFQGENAALRTEVAHFRGKALAEYDAAHRSIDEARRGMDETRRSGEHARDVTRLCQELEATAAQVRSQNETLEVELADSVECRARDIQIRETELTQLQAISRHSRTELAEEKRQRASLQQALKEHEDALRVSKSSCRRWERWHDEMAPKHAELEAQEEALVRRVCSLSSELDEGTARSHRSTAGSSRPPSPRGGAAQAARELDMMRFEYQAARDEQWMLRGALALREVHCREQEAQLRSLMSERCTGLLAEGRQSEQGAVGLHDGEHRVPVPVPPVGKALSPAPRRSRPPLMLSPRELGAVGGARSSQEGETTPADFSRLIAIGSLSSGAGQGASQGNQARASQEKTSEAPPRKNSSSETSTRAPSSSVEGGGAQSTPQTSPSATSRSSVASQRSNRSNQPESTNARPASIMMDMDAFRDRVLRSPVPVREGDPPTVPDFRSLEEAPAENNQSPLLRAAGMADIGSRAAPVFEPVLGGHRRQLSSSSNTGGTRRTGESGRAETERTSSSREQGGLLGPRVGSAPTLTRNGSTTNPLTSRFGAPSSRLRRAS